MKSNKLLYFFYGIFSFIGIILLVSGVLVYRSNQKFMSEAVEIRGVIESIETYRKSNGDTSHRVYVSYTYDGRQYKNMQVNFYSAGMYEGKEIALLCDPRNPDRVVVKGSDLFTIILLTVMGIIFSCVGIISTIRTVRNKTRKKKVRNTGRALYAIVDEVAYNTSFTLNGRHPYVIYCSYRDDYRNIVYRFKSENLWVNPEPYLTAGSTIKVYVEENNYKNYYVDTESMNQGKIVDYT